MFLWVGGGGSVGGIQLVDPMDQWQRLSGVRAMAGYVFGTVSRDFTEGHCRRLPYSSMFYCSRRDFYQEIEKDEFYYRGTISCGLAKFCSGKVLCKFAGAGHPVSVQLLSLFPETPNTKP
ncbi:hypothetical protein J6590_008367 [Homalodisca vitripennis]|nr:hypothetical protein J6590_008367 [Homalodisca vitripennis]